jgi:hypothetical protein
MKKTCFILLLSILICGCSTAPLPQQVKDQMQYSKTHKGYADAAAMQYALEHQITPDSAVVLRGEHKW